MIGGKQEPERLVSDQSAGQLGREGLPQSFSPAEGHVDTSGEQLVKGGACATAVPHREFGCRRRCPRRGHDPGRHESLADDIDEKWPIGTP